MPDIPRLEKDKEIATKHRFMALKDPIDERDFVIEKGVATAVSIPDEYILDYKMPVLDQGMVGSCVAHAIATAMGYGEMHLGVLQKGNDYSRGYIYGNRAPEDYQGEGMYPREALKQINKHGTVLHKDFKYNNKYPIVKAKIEENKEILAELAKEHKISKYFRAYTINDAKFALMETGAVIVFVPIFENFNSDLKKPKENEESDGAHEMCVIGWDKTGWIVQNSWSSAWGDKGIGHIMYDYPGCDFWAFYVKDPNSIEYIKDESTNVSIKKSCKIRLLLDKFISKFKK